MSIMTPAACPRAAGKTEVKKLEVILEVWGDFACFSKPESKVERLTYPVPTPSAVREPDKYGVYLSTVNRY